MKRNIFVTGMLVTLGVLIAACSTSPSSPAIIPQSGNWKGEYVDFWVSSNGSQLIPTVDSSSNAVTSLAYSFYGAIPWQDAANTQSVLSFQSPVPIADGAFTLDHPNNYDWVTIGNFTSSTECKGSNKCEACGNGNGLSVDWVAHPVGY